MEKKPRKPLPLYGRKDSIQLKRYLRHLQSLKNAKSVMRLKPPALRKPVGPSEIFGQTIQFWKTHNANLRFLNSLIFTKPEIKTINKAVRYPVPSNNQIANIKRAKEILTDNTYLKKQIGILQRSMLRRRPKRTSIDKEKITEPKKIYHPSIFLDLVALKERSIGRVTFQLYPEACPIIVGEILRYLHTKSDPICFPRVFTSLWAEAEIFDHEFEALDTNIDYDMYVLDHSSGPGILSIDPMDFKLLKKGLIVFAVSFKPLSVANGKRIPFGRIINGSRNLFCLSEYGNRNGVPPKRIVAANFGFSSVRRPSKSYQPKWN